MKDGLFLSNLLECSMLRKGVLNIIHAPCGSGKTYAAIHNLAQSGLVAAPRKVLYLIDTTNGKNALIQHNDELTLPYIFYKETINHTRFPSKDIPQDKFVVTTYAQFGVWARYDPENVSKLELIICDEMHSLVEFANFKGSPNYHVDAKEALCAAAEDGKAYVVAITATPTPLSKLNCPQYTIPIDTARLRQYGQKETIRYASLQNVIQRLPANQVGALYITHVEQMKKMETLARECGRKPICIWSASSTDHPMTEEQLAARSYILQNEQLPPDYDLFIFNAASKTSINLYGTIDFFIIHSSDQTTITQARGRYRGDLGTLYLRNDDGTFVMPDEWLNRPIYAEDKKAFQAAIGIKNGKGALIAFSDMLARAEQLGYTVKKSRKNDKRFTLITKSV